MSNQIAKYALDVLGGEPPLAVGEQARFSHGPCGDTRSRLYVKRVVNEKGQSGVLAFCHNCSAGGATYERGPARIMAVPSIVNPAPEKESLPADYEPANRVALEYMAKYRFDDADTRFFGVGWSENYQRIVLPVEDYPPGPSGRTAKGCQLRRVGDYGPKYITMRPTAEPLECVWWSSKVADITVITEDLLSAWRVWQAGYNAVPLLGAHVRPERLAKMVGDGHKDWVVWLDNDKPEIDKAARYMENLIRALGGRAWVSPSRREAKTCNVKQVRSHIQSVMQL